MGMLSAIALMAGVVAGGIAIAAGRGGSAPPPPAAGDADYQGVDLGGRPAPDFRLVDHQGNQAALSDFRGSVLVLAFLAPECSDVCPLTALQFRLAGERLGGAGVRAVFAGINTNPALNSVADVATASTRWGMDSLHSWHYLTGTEAELRRVWQEYGVAAGTPKAAKPAETDHTPAVFLLDPLGRLRRYISVPFGVEGFRPLSDLLVEQVPILLR